MCLLRGLSEASLPVGATSSGGVLCLGALLPGTADEQGQNSRKQVFRQRLAEPPSLKRTQDVITDTSTAHACGFTAWACRCFSACLLWPLPLFICPSSGASLQPRPCTAPPMSLAFPFFFLTPSTHDRDISPENADVYCELSFWT